MGDYALDLKSKSKGLSIGVSSKIGCHLPRWNGMELESPHMGVGPGGKFSVCCMLKL